MLKGKNALVTGSNRGIGRAITELFIQNGANVWACSRTLPPDFDTLETMAEKRGGWVRPVLFDMTDGEGRRQAIRAVTKEKLPVDILVNNAGRTEISLFLNNKIEDMRALFELNFFAQLEIAQLLGKRMITQKSGCIINMSSVVGLEPEAGRVAHGSAKAAFIMATRVMAKELGRFGVRVNAIAPGLMTNREENQTYTPEQIHQFTNETALGHMGTPGDIAQAALFLASDAAAYITGQVLRVDGGR